MKKNTYPIYIVFGSFLFFAIIFYLGGEVCPNKITIQKQVLDTVIVV